MWASDGWSGVVGMLAAGLGLALLIALRLRHLAPLAQRKLSLVVP
jgi:YNFM family putative membrane transporter